MFGWGGSAGWGSWAVGGLGGRCAAGRFGEDGLSRRECRAEGLGGSAGGEGLGGSAGQIELSLHQLFHVGENSPGFSCFIQETSRLQRLTRDGCSNDPLKVFFWTLGHPSPVKSKMIGHGHESPYYYFFFKFYIYYILLCLIF